MPTAIGQVKPCLPLPPGQMKRSETKPKENFPEHFSLKIKHSICWQPNIARLSSHFSHLTFSFFFS